MLRLSPWVSLTVVSSSSWQFKLKYLSGEMYYLFPIEVILFSEDIVMMDAFLINPPLTTIWLVTVTFGRNCTVR